MNTKIIALIATITYGQIHAAECIAMGIEANLEQLLSPRQSKISISPLGNKSTFLHLAITQNLHAACEELIEAGSDLKALDELGRTPLSLAISCGNVKACEMILKRGISLHAKDRHESMGAQAFLSDNHEIRELFAKVYINENRDKIDADLLQADFVKVIASGKMDSINQFLPPIQTPPQGVKTHHIRLDENDPGKTFFVMPKSEFDTLRAHNTTLIDGKRAEFGDKLFSTALFAAVIERQYGAIKRLIDYKAL